MKIQAVVVEIFAKQTGACLILPFLFILHNLSTKAPPKFEKYNKCLGYFPCVKIICLCILVTKIYFMIKVYTHFMVNKPQNLYHLLMNTLYILRNISNHYKQSHLKVPPAPN